MKRLFAVLFVSFFLLAVLAAADLSIANEKFFPIETEVLNRTATTYFVYAGIDSVEIINADQKTQKKKLEVKTFGNFTPLYDKNVIKFSRSKSPELLAYLVYKNGSSVNTKELLSVLYGDYADSARYGASLRLLISDIKHSLSELEIQNFFIAEYNNFRINPEVVQCDYYDLLAGDPKAVKSFTGEFMSQYSWAEDALDFLEKKAVGGN